MMTPWLSFALVANRVDNACIPVECKVNSYNEIVLGI
jgi:hypothetical protein